MNDGRLTITKRLEFDAGHRLFNHEGKCKNLHGHRWCADVTLTASALDSVGRVLDFGEIKGVLGGFIDEYIDHNMILNATEDVELVRLVSKWCKNGQPYLVPFNPTSENMAVHLAEKFSELLQNKFHGAVKLVKVSLYETPSSSAEFVLPNS